MTRRFTAADLEKLTEGTTPAPWEPFHNTWEDYGPDGEVIAGFEQFGVIGGADGILDTSPRPSLMDAPNQWADSGEHNNLANTRLAAAAPELAAEHHRIITALEGWRKEEQEVLATVDPTSLVDQLLIVAAQDNINWITRILEGDSNE